MKIQFNPDLEYQKQAIRSIVQVFDGQKISQSQFTVAPLGNQQMLGVVQTDLGVGNRLHLLPEEVLKNVRTVQLLNGLPPSERLNGMNFTVEMETGTGKTYVYLRTVFELNREYGFTKFIIVVPSIAIKEGVYKSLQITADHFKAHYDNVRFDYFVYDSEKLGQVRNFATSDYIQIMVINIDAFRKSFTDPDKEDKANIIHRPNDRMSGSKPIEFIRETNPVVIIDEPQSVDTTPKSREAISSLNPLCTLRYSATHVDQYNMLYKLDSVDAYEQQLVKKIEVKSIQVENSHNQAYIKLLAVDNRKSPITAQVELDVRQASGEVKRMKKTVRAGHDLVEIAGGRDVYEGYIIEEIYCAKGEEYISFTSKPEVIALGQAIGEFDAEEYKRRQIRETINAHLEKELELRPKGIKVLSLFFIDRVANYRTYDAEGHRQKGKYARIFEEEYTRALRLPKYRRLWEGADLETVAEGVHDGYFAIDKRKDASGSEMYKESRGEGTTQSDESAYALIMRDKEHLLSFNSKLKFIFSHSALKEGWDNPNVFQICTLNETASVMKKRQEIGRGLRIAVNQDGERVYGFEVNRLTVIANESYEAFARQLQQEIEAETGIKFGVVQKQLFAGIPVVGEGQEVTVLGAALSEQIWSHLKSRGYIDANGKVQDSLRLALNKGQVDLPPAVAAQESQILATLKKVAGRLNVNNADERQTVQLNKAVYLSPEFKELWERIKYRTTFRVEFDPEKLIAACAAKLRTDLSVGGARYVTYTAEVKIGRGGVDAEYLSESAAVYGESNFQLPDVISYLEHETKLTRRSLVEILRQSGRLSDFKRNPQRFMEQAAAIINLQKSLFIVDGIRYERLGDQHFYAQELFAESELYGYLSQNMLATKKGVHEYLVDDSGIERAFAQAFEHSADVKVYAKLPGWFKIGTPLGNYNPDWAVLIEVDGQPRLYFVIESKGKILSDALRATEAGKIDCGRAHFKALSNDVQFTFSSSYEDFLSKIVR